MDGSETIGSTGIDSDSGFLGCMVTQGVSKDCIFDEDFGNVFKSAIGALVYKLR